MDSEHQQMDVDPEEAVVDAAEDGIEEKQPEGDDQPEEESEGEDEEADGDGAGADPAREQKTAATRSGRKRKPVQRLVNQSVARSSLKPVEIMEGKGVRLGDIEAVEEELQRARGTDKWLRKLHTVLFPGASVNKSTVKKNIRDFSGFVDTSAEMRQARISKLTVLSKQEMSDLATLLQQHRGGTKEDVAGRIVEFLECPQNVRGAARGKRKRASGKKAKGSGSRPLTGYMLFVQQHRSEVVQEQPDLKFGDIARELSRRWRALSDKQREAYKSGGAPAARPKKKKARKVSTEEEEDSDASSDDDEPIMKKPKVDKSRISQRVQNIMETNDMTKLTFGDIKKLLSKDFGADVVKENKPWIKDLVKKHVASMNQA